MTRIATRPYPLRASELLRQNGMHPVLARLYAARNACDHAALSTELSALLSPAGLHQIAPTAKLLADAISAQKKLVIVADYDCDGATACAVALRGLRMLGAEVDYIVPNRFEYGYGLTPEIVALTIREKAPDIIITVDNGIASVDGVAAAAAAGVPVVVTDHHLPGQELPEAAAIVNPNQPDCQFASKNLAGVGVMFYVLLALRAELRARGVFDQQSQPKLDSLLDLVALGTVADVVVLDANNRILVAQGLKRMRAGRMCPGIAALFRVAGREPRSASPFDLGFALGPRLNAAGRLADMALGIECLSTDDEGRAWAIAQELNGINADRKEIEREMQDVAMLHLDQFDPGSKHSITVYDDSWHQGVIGIVASRLKDKFYRPTITFAPGSDGIIKGSGRSIPGFHLRDALDLVSKHAPGLIQKFGGHAMAAGLTLQQGDLAAFTAAFEAVAQSWLSQSELERIITTDGILEESYFTTDFIALLDGQVWGQGFPVPLFCDDFKLISQRVLKERHLKLQLEKHGKRYEAIWFGHTDSLPERVRVAFRLDANEYNGVTRVQLLVEHIEASSP
ncbi:MULTISPECIES: single-stranded-DNA-specific exonuclease RecJ [unclassified Undibacterium]|uniref:single-stranded-DNA-specific exonuclease RecJ n=1 Tax=unclassified Undibacterium TaxID=2630295 RepID=UPI002AC91812|nr:MULTISPECIES: single-stranded-DNA-specific exonuclease RecJ [unclassified Undibacterium]MEB0140244.1 single-stranded-DNA-specific exonuclease RecJ [Undibacterium sp. CCC2.1]MEB0173275.1 single-stranded-DNA-specific exonuclease RecJ [Undibacterium sp. CCC1.1]MEB0177102.1 single-stranded-DNA-specific exonuclease RecJ [Undibacterium sp. CCC3.4]MEB0216383.1 single-stranded-DNA-specific exonuclease RecJ [Undibacterium sp. 5I2]WPX42993.1 single-stranded-DNA-specific exonuclease RecJ [Undibacteriu